MESRERWKQTKQVLKVNPKMEGRNNKGQTENENTTEQLKIKTYWGKLVM